MVRHVLTTWPDATDPYQERMSAHSGLDFAYGPGRVRADNVIAETVQGTVTLADNTTNYVEVDTAGTVSANAIGFTAGRLPLYQVVTASGAISTVEDKRALLGHGGEGAPTPHDLGGAHHGADTLANLNSKVSDATLDDAAATRDPNAHATTHEPGGSDAMAVDAAAGTGSLRTLGTGGTQAAAGDHDHDSDYAPLHPTINTQTDSYTLVLTDDGKIVEINHAEAKTLTVPENASVAFPVGTVIGVSQVGAGAVSVAGAGAATIRVLSGFDATLVGQWAQAVLVKRATDEWVLTGQLVETTP